MADTYTLISSVTVGAGGASSMAFSSIPATYTDLKLVVSARSTGSGDDNTRVKFNSDSGVTYSNRNLWGSGSSALSESVSGTDKLLGDYASGYLPNNSATANTFNNYEIYIPNYAGSTQKSVSIDNGSENNSASTYIRTALGAGLRADTSAINAITITCFNNFVQYSTAYLYGIKNS